MPSKERNEQQEKQREYYLEHKDAILNRARELYIKNREAKLAYSAEYQRNNVEKKRVWQKRHRDSEKGKKTRTLWRETNRLGYSKRLLERQRERERQDPSYKLANRLRHRLYMAIRGSHKRGSAIQDLGCSVQELKLHIERQFQDGMTWENWGVNGWHVDHKIPLTHFDLTKHEDVMKACHYTNLQPLWARDNILKSNKLYGVAQ